MRKWLIIASVLIVVSVMGCAHQPSVIQQGADQQVEQVDAAQTVADAEAVAKPIDHPISSANVVIKKAQPVLGKIAVLAFVATCVMVGLMFTAFSAVSKVGLPVAGALLAGSILGLFALPVAPYIFLGLGVVLAALIAYECYQHGMKGVLDQLITAVTFGVIKPVVTTPAPVPAVHPGPPLIK